MSFKIGANILALEQEEEMYINNKIYKNTLSTYTKNSSNAEKIAKEA
jgi:hypothetical protein